MKIKRLSVSLTLAFVIFCFGACAKRAEVAPLPLDEPARMLEIEERAAKESVLSKISFRQISTGDGTLVDGGEAASQVYESSTGEKVSHTQSRYESPESARRQFEADLKEPNVKILERDDDFGRKRAKRVVLIQTENDLSIAKVVTVEENFIRTINSRSLRTALAFELMELIGHAN